MTFGYHREYLEQQIHGHINRYNATTLLQYSCRVVKTVFDGRRQKAHRAVGLYRYLCSIRSPERRFVRQVFDKRRFIDFHA